ncbi:MAG: 3-deoxy-D-manno-octulosonic acid transferase [Methylovirgula sp.]|nr:3-deoxy-D-manno-octulosonic acid transferase [Methylovirgula sp.]
MPIYQAASAALAPFSPVVLYVRRKWRRDELDRDGERLGRPTQPRPDGPLAWLHGGSVGESLALLPLVEQLSARGFTILVSTGTSSAAAVIAPRLPAGALHQFLPLDVPQFLARFLAHWRPNLALIAESEIWPNLFLAVRRRNIPLLLVNARISEASFQRWRWFPSFIGTLLEAVDLCLAQSQADAERFALLGARHVKVAGNLKYDVSAPPADRQALAALAVRVGARPVWVAASTHRGEEEIILAAHQMAAEFVPGLLTIIVPRHAKRGGEIASLARARGLDVAQRSTEAYENGALPEVYVADTTGELGLFYRLASIAFLGKSLLPAANGGQNPIEPAKLGCAILHGPHVANFSEVYQVLDEARGAVTVADADTMARVVAILLADAGKMRLMARAASETVKGLGGACERIMSAIEPHLAQLSFESRQWQH